jgi:UDP-N-acetylglucosamine--N-acetylmuramyl-(pentapeptide) pyrophosphoryl-undecaprenol N-acetylglucosamine transferase
MTTDVLLVGGGTAGHVIPAIATAQALTRLDPDLEVAFAGLSGSIEERLVHAAGFPFHQVTAVPLPRRPSPALISVLPMLARSRRRAARLLSELGVRTVVSFGGYVSLPIALATKGRMPLIVHEQNSRPGLANRLACRSARHVAVSFPSSIERMPDPDRCRFTGNPVQQGLRDLDVVGRRAAARERFGLSLTRPTLLVFGGSQGAQSINNAVIGAVEAWRRLGVQVLHVTGPRGHEASMEAWRAVGIEPEADGSDVRIYAFLDDMADAYAAADVVVARAGATTIAELTVLGIPSVLVPYPHATADHQRANAAALVHVGAAMMLDDADLDAVALAAAVEPLFTDPAIAGAMALAARAWGRPDAADGLAAIVLTALAAVPRRVAGTDPSTPPAGAVASGAEEREVTPGDMEGSARDLGGTDGDGRSDG